MIFMLTLSSIRRICLAIVSCALLGACVDGGNTLANTRNGPSLPPGAEHVNEAVDGLIVGHRLMAAGEYTLALAAYSRAIRTQGLSSDVLSAIGSANMRLGRLNQAERFLETAVESDPDFVPAWNNLGVVQMSRGNYIAARASFERAFALDNGDSDEIRANLINVNHILSQISAEIPQDVDFLLVRRGDGRYLLLGQN